MLNTYRNCPEGMVLYSGPYAHRPEQRLTFMPLYYAASIGDPRPEVVLRRLYSRASTSRPKPRWTWPLASAVPLWKTCVAESFLPAEHQTLYARLLDKRLAVLGIG
jgi:hypothetical protein